MIVLQNPSNHLPAMFLCHILLLTTCSTECSLYSPCINGYIGSTTTVVDYATAQNATIDIISGDARCNAGRGCHNSNKHVAVDNVYCYADQSCAHLKFTNGAYSLYDSSNTNPMIQKFR